MRLAVILLAGGLGSRMGSSVPKQFLTLAGKPIVLHSFELFRQLPDKPEIIVVSELNYRHLFQNEPWVKFALPGERRQDSVWNGLQAVSDDIELLCVHDAARPLVDSKTIAKVIDEAKTYGAAVAAVPMKCTVKESREGGFVGRTLDRSRLWEIQTPQAMKRSFLEEGFAQAFDRNLTVTDDVSLVELIGEQVKIVEATYANIKITTKEDLHFAEMLLEKTHG